MYQVFTTFLLYQVMLINVIHHFYSYNIGLLFFQNGVKSGYEKKVWKRLRELRTAKMLTQENVAELIDIKPENYSRIENGLSFP